MRDANWLAIKFLGWREVVEAAETPFAKLAIFILPIIAPIVPAVFTGLHVYKLLLEIFTFSWASGVSTILSFVTSLVLELLGYVGAISFIQSLFRWIRTKGDEYMLPTVLNFFSYTFYLLAMYLVNYQLGKYFNTPDIVNKIVGLLSFITVPTSLLAANHLSQKEEKEDEELERARNEQRQREMEESRKQERLEKYRIKHGKFLPAMESFQQKVETFQQLSNTSRKFPESFYQFSSSWRKLSTALSREELEWLAQITPAEMKELSSEVGKDYRTISNWRRDAQIVLSRGSYEQ